MATRKDLLKAHDFTTQRLVNALVSRNPDEVQPPLRRIKTGTLVGALIGTLVTAGFGVWGLLDPGSSKKWKEDQSAIVDTSSGVTYVYLNEVLHPTPNLASSLLAAGSDSPKIVRVSGRSLSDEPRGVPIGIPDAPDALPGEKQLVAYPLRTCAGRVKDDRRPTTLEIGRGSAPTHSQSVLLANEQGELVLVLDGVAHLLPNHRNAPPAWLAQLKFAAVRTGQAFIDSLPVGVPLTRIRVANEGEDPLKPVGAARVGWIGSTKNQQGEDLWWVLQKDGFSRITYIDAELMRSDGIREIPNLTIDQVEANPSKQSFLNSGNIPEGVPQAPFNVTGEVPVCATWAAAGRPPTITVNDGDVPAVDKRGEDPARADKVVVAPGRGALLQSADADDPQAASSLVVNGLRYPIPDGSSRAMLGYSKPPTPVPAQILSLIPEGMAEGHVLSPSAARQQLG